MTGPPFKVALDKKKASGKAIKALQKYVADVNKLAGKGQVPATVAPDLAAGAAALIEDLGELIGA